MAERGESRLNLRHRRVGPGRGGEAFDLVAEGADFGLVLGNVAGECPSRVFAGLGTAVGSRDLALKALRFEAGEQTAHGAHRPGAFKVGAQGRGAGAMLLRLPRSRDCARARGRKCLFPLGETAARTLDLLEVFQCADESALLGLKGRRLASS